MSDTECADACHDEAVSDTVTPPVDDDVWRAVPGQEQAVARLRAAVASPVHAYLFVGPPGSGKEAAARTFAGELLAATASDPAAAERHRRLASDEQHPDIAFVRREGASIRVEQAAEIVRLASMKPVEGSRKMLVLDEFHLVADATAGKLLKTIEEPPGDTVFVVLADDLSDELVTIASRCVQIPFPSLTSEAVASALVADGVDPDVADRSARAAHGDLDRARLLATDERLALRLAAWAEIPGRLDGTGATVAEIVAARRADIDSAAEPLEARQQAEREALEERIERYGERGAGARHLEERHKRQSRRLRTDEVRMGLAEMAQTYRQVVVGDPPAGLAVDPVQAGAALDRIWPAVDALVRNPNEELLLQALLLDLPPGRP